MLCYLCIILCGFKQTPNKVVLYSRCIQTRFQWGIYLEERHFIYKAFRMCSTLWKEINVILKTRENSCNCTVHVMGFLWQSICQGMQNPVEKGIFWNGWFRGAALILLNPPTPAQLQSCRNKEQQFYTCLVYVAFMTPWSIFFMVYGFGSCDHILPLSPP